MTEGDFRTCIDPASLLAFVRERASDRRLRLLACACARRAWERLDAAGRWAVEAAERFADDGAATGEELGAARAAAHEAALAAVSGWGANRRHDHAKFAAASAAAPDAGEAAVTASQDMLRLADEGRRAEEEAAQVADIRCVFGGLFHAVGVESEWRTATVLALAQQADEAREFGVLPIVADALQDAGCDDEELLNHLRAGEPHTHGCWALDSVLGKG